MRRHAHRGFTIVEVLVALVIVAFGMGALMATLTSAADSVARLREKSFAEWIALNRVSEMRLRGNALQPGKSSGEIDYGGARWRWNQEIVTTELANLQRIDVTVSRAGKQDEKAGPLATASGFVGASLKDGDGETIDWSGQDQKEHPPESTGTQKDSTDASKSPGSGSASPPGPGAPVAPVAPGADQGKD